MASKDRRSPAELPWWALIGDPKTQERGAKRLVEDCKQACRDNSHRSQEAKQYLSAYDGSRLGTNETVIANTVRSIAQTYVAKVAALDTPLPQWMATDGDFATRQAAHDRTLWCEALHEQQHGRFPNAGDLQRHALFTSLPTGSVMVFPEVSPVTGRCEYHLDDTLTVGIVRNDSMSGIQTLVRTRIYTVEDALARWPKSEQAILKAQEGCGPEVLGKDGTPNGRQMRLVVRQGWRMAQHGVDGVWAEVIEGGHILARGEYPFEEAPCARHDFERAVDGEFGIPMFRELWDAFKAEQRAWNDRLDSHSTMSQLHIAYNAEDLVDPEAVGRGRNIKLYELTSRNAMPPQVLTPPRENRDTVNFVADINATMHEQSGVSQAHAGGKKVEGTRSGKHEHLVASLFTERFADHEQRFTRFRAVDMPAAAVRAVQLAQSEYPLKWRGEHEERELRVRDLGDEEKMGMKLQVAPVSAERNTPRAKYERMEQRFDAGQMSASDLLDFERHYDSVAPSGIVQMVVEWTDKQMQRWLTARDEDLQDPEIVQVPTQYVGLPALEAAVAKAAEGHSRARMAKVPQERLDKFELYLGHLAALIQAEQARLEPPAPPMSAPPGAGPAGAALAAGPPLAPSMAGAPPEAMLG